MLYREIVENELRKNKISWCTGQCGREGHKRGFVFNGEPVIHYDSQLATRSTLHAFFHELGHALDTNHKNKRRFEKEATAERFASDKMQEYRIPVPRKTKSLGNRYIARWKKFGNKIIKAKQQQRQSRA